MHIRKLCESAVLITVALIIFRVEAAIPLPVAIPGIKLGLANVVTLTALFLLPKGWVYGILALRVLLVSILIGNPMSAFYGFAGGTLCFLITLIFKNRVTRDQIWVLGVLGAIAHNFGQIGVAVILTRSWVILGYFPFLLISAILTGILTGLIVQFLIRRLYRIPGYRERILRYHPNKKKGH